MSTQRGAFHSRQIEPLIFVQAERAVVTASRAQGFGAQVACSLPVRSSDLHGQKQWQSETRTVKGLHFVRPDGCLLGG